MPVANFGDRHFLCLAIETRQSTFGNSQNGGIAQLVERQLCKLEVRGSNPLASKIQRSEITKLSGDENLVRPVGRGARGARAALSSWRRASAQPIPLPPKPERRGGNVYKLGTLLHALARA